MSQAIVEEAIAVGVALAGNGEAGGLVERAGPGPVGPGVLPHAQTASEMVTMPTVNRRKR
jgi:hypothetical protein